ncbi:MAG: hypothetical protein U0174_22925 [Polyangiaceae bacterium]
MLRLVLRLAVSLVAMLVVWTTASVARADAPQCDKRCAVTFVEAPSLEVPDVSIDGAIASSDEQAESADERGAFWQQDFPQKATDLSPSGPESILPTFLALPVRVFSEVSWPRHALGHFRPGVSVGLERPPR